MNNQMYLSMGIAAASIVAGIASADVIISDGQFDPSDWSLAANPYGDFGGGASGGQVALVGNPGNARSVTNSYGPSFSGSYNASMYEAFTYNPSVGGPLTDLSFSVDSRYEDSLNAIGFVARQGAYTWGIGYMLNGAAWDTYTLTPIASDYFVYPFGPLDGPQPAMPDFSATGGPIFFGFWSGNGSGGGGGGAATGLFDNFTVSFVPAPAAAGLLACGLLAAARRRRG